MYQKYILIKNNHLNGTKFQPLNSLKVNVLLTTEEEYLDLITFTSSLVFGLIVCIGYVI